MRVLCQGLIRLTSGKTLLARRSYRIPAGRVGNVVVRLDKLALELLQQNRRHEIAAVVTVRAFGGLTRRRIIHIAGR